MRLRTRYLVSLLGLVAIVAVPALYGVVRVRDLHAIAVDLRQQSAGAVIAAGRASRQIAELDRHQRAYVATAGPEQLARMHDALDAIEAHAEELAAVAHPETATAGLPVRELRAAADSLRVLVESDSLEAATTYVVLVARPLFGAADDALLELSQAMEQEIAARADEAGRIASAAVATTAGALPLALLAAGLLAWLAARLLTGPLERLGAAMGAVADGRLENPDDPAAARADEVGMLFRSFQAMTTRLVQLDRIKAELVGMASHDFKTPISVITGYAELLEEARERLEPRERDVLASLQRQVRALGDRVDQLIEISRMEARGLRLGLEEIHVRHFAAGLETAFALLARRHDVELAVTVAAEAPTFLIADPDCLRTEILANVVEHCLKFSPRGGAVRIEFRGGGSRLQIELRDQGPPVAAHDAERLFDRYFRGPATGGRVGSGLALPIARAAAEAHGGLLRASPQGVGACFLLDLPVRPGIVLQATDEVHDQVPA
jgi:signal transduction histidine kinase